MGMRYPDLSRSVTILDGKTYTLANLLAEFCWGAGFWSNDESSVASFERVKGALRSAKTAFVDVAGVATPTVVEFENNDFDRIAGHLRQLNFPPHVAIELTELRNAFVMAPSEKK